MTDTARQDKGKGSARSLTALHQQVRLYRIAKELGISDETLSQLEARLSSSTSSAGDDQTTQPQAKTQPSIVNLAEGAQAKLTLEKPKPEPQPEPKPEPEPELTIKQQVEQLALAPDNEGLAKHSEWLSQHYKELEPFIRERIINSYAASQLPSYVTTVPAAERTELEHLASYLLLKAQEPADAALSYALEHQAAIVAVLSRESRWFGRPVDAIALEWAEPMLAKGWQKQGFNTLAIIPSTRGGKPNPAYSDALVLVAKYRDEKSTAELVTRLRNQYDPKLKRQQLSFWLKKAKPTISKPTPKALWLRGSLQPVFADLTSTFEHHPTSLGQMAELLIDHKDALATMPYLWDTMVAASQQFLTPTLTHALWRHFHQLRCSPSDHPVIRGVVAVAKLQLFLMDTFRDEAGIWWAREQLADPAVVKALSSALARTVGQDSQNHTKSTTYNSSMYKSSIGWAGLASKWLASLDTPQRRTIEGRDYLKAFMRLTLGAPITPAQVQSYLKLAKSPAEASLTTIIARSTGQNPAPEVAIEAYGRLILVRPLTNRELEDWLRLCENSQHLDLAWRITTTLKFRQVLSPAYDQAWLYSGENQNPTPLSKVAAPELEGFFGYHPLAAQLLQGFVQAGPLLTTVFGKAPPASGQPLTLDPLALTELGISREEQVWDEKCVSTLLDQLPAAARKHQPFTPPLITGESSTEGDARARQWLITYYRVCQFYGLARLEFHLSNLSELEERLVAGTCFAKGGSDRAAAGAAGAARAARGGGVAAERYFGLEAEQKQHMRQFLSLGRHFQGSQGEIWGQRMMVLLTLIHLPSHYFALAILEEINCPLTTIRWAESMILTKGYSSLRLTQGLSGHIPFPQNLRNFPRISPAPGY